MKTNRVLRLLAPLLLLLFVACAGFPGSGEIATTSTPEQRAQATSLVDAAADALTVAAGWMEPAEFTKGQKTLDALRQVIAASEFVPVSWATAVGTAMRLAAVWMAPPPKVAPSG